MVKETKTRDGLYLDSETTGDTLLAAWRGEDHFWGVDYAGRHYELTTDELDTLAAIVKRTGH